MQTCICLFSINFCMSYIWSTYIQIVKVLKYKADIAGVENIPRWVKSFAKFWLCKALFGCSRWFCLSCEGDKPHWNVVWFGLVLWDINHCCLLNAKSSLCIYIKYIWFALVEFYGISTIVGYLMPNPLYAYIWDIYDLLWLGFMAYQPL